MTPKEALKRIETVKAWNGGVYRQYTSSTEPFMEDIINVEEALTELEELKKRDTPMKVVVTPYKKVVGEVNEFYIGNMYSCPQCHGVLLMDKWQQSIEELEKTGDMPKYCECCGQRLDWSDEK